MAHRGKAIEHLADHALGGRVWCAQFRVGILKGLQGLKEPVVFGVGNRRFVEDVVTVVVTVDLVAQLCGAGVEWSIVALVLAVPAVFAAVLNVFDIVTPDGF